MELTVTITSVQIPERSAMIFATDRPNTEFDFLGGSRITVVKDSNNSVVAIGTLINSEAKAGSSATFSFPYNNALAPYSVHLEIQATTQIGNIVCKADCTPVAGGSGWYFSYSYPTYSGGSATCPSSVCAGTSGRQNAIAFDPTHVVGGYWRSPAIFTIN